MTRARVPATVILGGLVPSVEHPDGQVRDVLVDGGRIVAMDQDAVRSAPAEHRVLDARGRLLLPGFVDAHSHADSRIHDPDVQLALLRQGVTAVAVGLDGLGFAPTLGDDALHYATEYFQAINGSPPPGLRGGTIADLRAASRSLPVRVLPLVPHGLLRYGVVGAASRPATDSEIDHMCAVATQAFAEGAHGLSTGLEYVPGAYADDRELRALCTVAAAHQRPHVTHMRGYESAAVKALAEVVELSHATGVATHISHLHGPHEEIIAAVDAARVAGVSLTFDSYPYLRGCSILGMLLLPHWLPVAERHETTRLLTDPVVRDKLLQTHLVHLEDLWPRITIASAPGAEHTEGSSLLTVAHRWRLTPAEAAVELLVATELRVGAIFEQPPTNSPESVRALANHPEHMAGSDAIYQGSRPHPRGWGTFARFLHQHVIESGDWSWFDAIEHLSARASRLFGLQQGRVEVGAPADLVLVDSAVVRDRATYERPMIPSVGVDDALVDGVPVLADGMLCAQPRP